MSCIFNYYIFSPGFLWISASLLNRPPLANLSSIRSLLSKLSLFGLPLLRSRIKIFGPENYLKKFSGFAGNPRPLSYRYNALPTELSMPHESGRVWISSVVAAARIYNHVYILLLL